MKVALIGAGAKVFVCDIDAKALECFKAEILPPLHSEQNKKRLAARGDCSRPRSVIYTLDHPLDSNRKERAWRRASATDPLSWRANMSLGSSVSSCGCATPSAPVALPDLLSATPSTASSSRRPTKHTSTCGC